MQRIAIAAIVWTFLSVPTALVVGAAMRTARVRVPLDERGVWQFKGSHEEIFDIVKLERAERAERLARDAARALDDQTGPDTHSYRGAPCPTTPSPMPGTLSPPWRLKVSRSSVGKED